MARLILQHGAGVCRSCTCTLSRRQQNQKQVRAAGAPRCCEWCMLRGSTFKPATWSGRLPLVHLYTSKPAA
eukprot:1138933-Pelagomonas_calceolata.AAC.7